MLYIDQMGVFNKLTDEQSGKLIKHIFKYCNDESPEGDFVTELAFESIKQALKRDLRKYENICERNKTNGSKGGRPKKPKKPSGLLGNPSKPKKPDSDNDSDRDKDKDKDINTYRAFDNLSITKEQVEKLKTEYEIRTIDLVLDNIENFKDNKKYKNLYLTAKNWLKKEPKKKSVELQEKQVKKTWSVANHKKSLENDTQG